jgi:hypothetical protein
MTSLRDSRFEKALEAAPDAHLRPDARTRQAVLQAAAAAVQAQPARPPVARWRRWWSGGADGGAGRMPWNAAFATVLLAGFVTLLWQGQPVPDARLDDAPPVTKPAEAPAVAADVVPSVPPITAPPNAPSPPPTPQAQSAPSGAPAARPATPAKAAADSAARVAPPQSAKRQEPAPASAPAPAPAPAPAIAQERSSEAGTGAMAPSAPAIVTRELRPPPDTAQPASAAAASAAASLSPAARPMPAPRADAAAATPESGLRGLTSAEPAAPARAAAPGLAAGNAFGRAAPLATHDPPALHGWTELRITQGGRTRRVARVEAAALAALAEQMRRLVPIAGEGVLHGDTFVRIAFVQGDAVLAELELGEPPWVRWTLLRPGFAGQWTAQADRGQLLTLQLELQRLGFTAR